MGAVNTFYKHAQATACFEILQHSGVDLKEKHVIIAVGSEDLSRNFLLSLSELLFQVDAYVSTFSLSDEDNFSDPARDVDVFISSVGAPGKITRHHYRNADVIIDCGMHFVAGSNRFVGDIDCREILSTGSTIKFIHGIHKVVTACVMRNLLASAKHVHNDGQIESLPSVPSAEAGDSNQQSTEEGDTRDDGDQLSHEESEIRRGGQLLPEEGDPHGDDGQLLPEEGNPHGDDGQVLPEEGNPHGDDQLSHEEGDIRRDDQLLPEEGDPHGDVDQLSHEEGEDSSDEGEDDNEEQLSHEEGEDSSDEGEDDNEEHHLGAYSRPRPVQARLMVLPSCGALPGICANELGKVSSVFCYRGEDRYPNHCFLCGKHFKVGIYYRVTFCEHYFDDECFTDAVKYNASCPECNTDFLCLLD